MVIDSSTLCLPAPSGGEAEKSPLLTGLGGKACYICEKPLRRSQRIPLTSPLLSDQPMWLMLRRIFRIDASEARMEEVLRNEMACSECASALTELDDWEQRVLEIQRSLRQMYEGRSKGSSLATPLTDPSSRGVSQAPSPQRVTRSSSREQGRRRRTSRGVSEDESAREAKGMDLPAVEASSPGEGEPGEPTADEGVPVERDGPEEGQREASPPAGDAQEETPPTPRSSRSQRGTARRIKRKAKEGEGVAEGATPPPPQAPPPATNAPPKERCEYILPNPAPKRQRPPPRPPPETFICRKCDTVFQTKEDLGAHLVSHGELPFRCSICNSGFRYEENLTLHVGKYHGVFNPERSSFMGKEVKQVINEVQKKHCKVFVKEKEEDVEASNLHQDPLDIATTDLTSLPPPSKMRRFKGIDKDLEHSFTCLRCQAKFRTKYFFWEHHRKHHFFVGIADDLESRVEHGVIGSGGGLEEPRPVTLAAQDAAHSIEWGHGGSGKVDESEAVDREASGGTVKPRRSGRSKRSRTIVSPIDEETVLGLSSSSDEYVPSSDEDSEPPSPSATDHLMDGEDSGCALACDICRKDCRDYVELESHRLDTHGDMGRLFCDTCPEAFDNFADLDEHRRGHTSRGDFSCEICGRRCSRRDKLRLHLWRHEATGCSILSQKAADQQMRATSKCPTCEVCGKAFADYKHLGNHMATHSFRYQHQCDICSRKFKNARLLRAHYNRHGNQNKLVCPDCGKTFVDKSSLNLHVKTMHKRIRSHTCETCGKSFLRGQHLRDHMATHTNSKKFFCPDCNYGCISLWKLQNHQRKHTGEKPYNCPYCSRTFSQKCNMTNHVRLHTGEKRFPCPLCGKDFERRKLQEHHVPLCSARSCLLAQEGKTLTRRGAATISEIAASLPRDSTLRLDGERLLAAAKLAQSTERLPVPQNKRPLPQSPGMSPTTIQTQSQGVSPTIISQSQGISPTILPQSQGIGPTVIQSQSEGISPTILPQSQGIGPTVIQTQSQGISPTIISQSYGISQTILPQSQGIGPTVIQTQSQGISPTILHLSQGISHISQAQGISPVPQAQLVSLPVTSTTHRLIAIRPSSLTSITSTPVSFIVSPQPQPTQISSPAPGQFQDNAMMPQYAYNAPRTVPIATAQQQLAINEPMDDAHYGPM